MKTKIFALILTVLCLSLILVACDKPCETHKDENNDALCDVCGEAVEQETETETEGVCDHVDADADKTCDACGKGIVTIVEQLPAETEVPVDMVVNPIPEGGANGYLNTELSDYEFLKDSIKLENVVDNNGNYAVTVNGEIGTRTFAVVDLSASGTAVIKNETEPKDETGATRTEIEIELYDEWFIVKKITKARVDGSSPAYFDEQVKIVIDVYTYANEKIGETYTWEPAQNLTDSFVAPVDMNLAHINECYVSFNDMIYVIDVETDKIIHTSLPDTLVERPEMDEIVGNYGYVIDVDGVYVYDLTKWISCVYSYEYPTKFEDANAAVLANGKILVYASVQLADSAVSYDYLESGSKYDLVYIMIDAKTGEEKAVEFGYKIDSVSRIEEGDAMFTEKAVGLNVFTVSLVEDGYINSANTKDLVVDNELKIVATVAVYGDVLVDDDLYIREVTFNDGRMVYELVNSNGEHVDYLPITSNIAEGYKIIGNVLWSYDNKEIIDFDDYSNHMDVLPGYAILAEEIIENDVPTGNYKVYSYIPGGVPQQIDTSKNTIIKAHGIGYEVSYTKTNADDTTVTEYALYNARNEQIYSGATSEILDISYVGDNVIVETVDGVIYVLK